MTKATKQREDEEGPDQRTVAAEPVAKAKKTYSKPVLSSYEQLHGIGLGS